MRPSIDQVTFIDLETFTDGGKYSLAHMSARAYITDGRFDILTVAIADGEGLISFYYKFGAAGQSLDDAWLRLRTGAAAGRTLAVHNLGFDGLALKLRLGIEFQHFFDTTGYLRYLGLGASLGNGAQFLGLQKFDHPPFDEGTLRDPVALAKIARYNMKDVVICRRLFIAALADEGFPDLEFWAVDANGRENLRGLPIDRDRARELGLLLANRRAELLTQFCNDYAFDTSRLNSPAAVLEFARDAFGVTLTALRKKSAEVATTMAASPAFAKFFLHRDAIKARGSWSKKLLAIADGPTRVYSAIRYYAAHTGRFAGGGMNADNVNIQSMPKGDKREFPELMDYRKILATDADESWVGSDLSTIEPRVLGFLAGELALLQRFAQGADVYLWFGGRAFPGVRIVKGGKNKHLRDLSKEAVLGLGFGMGPDRFHRTLVGKGIEISFDEVKRLHVLYQATFPEIIQLRKTYFRAFTTAAEHGTVLERGYCWFNRFFESNGDLSISIRLPTGRKLYYRSIKKTWEDKGQWGYGWSHWYADALQLDPSGKNAGGKGTGKKRKFPDGQIRTEITPQMIIENIVQAVARDIVVAQAREIERRGLPVRFTVHDELIAASARCGCPRRGDPVPEGKKVEVNHDEGCPWLAARGVVKEEMSRVPPCFPALVALPVACELSDAVLDAYAK